ncbi:uncharacterized protein A1O5_04050 [Cladophialophora psammophila CBS 110553]|uniref:Uncharacterized protein n=1 Tax=Cladophialophora psammophila CBS 110553 TaxID=1182543 RepID=W9WXI0_9EURO|nr:uncharacterized protein A1O5_04050 [Cladophialophora psammophila CBS 110553]EXJ72902.1 hypothetical protein A1O5_04050 [Cladophialophora psammophila CBS 110553]
MEKYVHDETKYFNLSGRACLKRFSDPFGPTPNLFVVVDDGGSLDYSLLEFKAMGAGENGAIEFDSQTWICSSGTVNGCESAMPYTLDPKNPFCGYPRDFSDERIAHWNKYGYHVLYCLALRNDGNYCSVQFWPLIVLIICICNVVKWSCILFCLIRSEKDATLCTLGDAISCFLQNPTATSWKRNVATAVL